MYEQEIVEEVRELPQEQQKEVLDFAAFLHQRLLGRPQRSIKGSLEHLNIHLTQEDFDE